VQAFFQQQVKIAVDAAGQLILHRNKAVVGKPFFHAFEHLLKGTVRQAVTAIVEHFLRSYLAESIMIALEGDRDERGVGLFHMIRKKNELKNRHLE